MGPFGHSHSLVVGFQTMSYWVVVFVLVFAGQAQNFFVSSQRIMVYSELFVTVGCGHSQNMAVGLYEGLA